MKKLKGKRNNSNINNGSRRGIRHKGRGTRDKGQATRDNNSNNEGSRVASNKATSLTGRQASNGATSLAGRVASNDPTAGVEILTATSLAGRETIPTAISRKAGLIIPKNN